ncbi:hypothetical protein L226DRAFT_576655 [Lentinus tigrinus ALCF2SS1-7]|uniref:Uncharacterized protein n=1 Tax=Lentinus tigrinus ALCF2SS1-6 TaxID=1328759 RepID=A0A5C2RQY3_9APHY|nr:hypothetical protein L227DRAFT_617424 [Lentinus tigrinus ALCF2SS1-6]RPD68134.1 hypothetical protein L226DRAFT_576655 [Lentinus tigrinus ALCF2SS1-7]
MSTSPIRKQHQERDAPADEREDDLLADYFERSASAVRNVFGRFEGDVARPLISYLLVSFRERPITSTFVATYVALSALPVLSFLGFSIFIFATFTFLALGVAILCASSVVGFVGFWLFCILLVFLLVAFILTLSVLITFILVRFLLHARQDGPRAALSELADDARTQYALARGRPPGLGPEHDDTSVKEEPESEADSVVVVVPQTQDSGPEVGALEMPVDAPA